MPIVLKWKWVLRVLSYINGFPVDGFCCFPFIFIKEEASDRLIRHETIHYHQMKETLVLGYLIIYIVSYLINRYKKMSHQVAYRNIIFEVEAYDNQHIVDYLKYRKKYNWYQGGEK